jgi:signal transduction histidine kinase
MRIAHRLLQRIQGLSLGTKLACTFVLLIYGVSMLLTLISLHHQRAALGEELIQEATLVAENTARLATDLVLRQDIWELYKLSRDIAQGEAPGRQHHPVLYAMILNAGGEVLAHSRPAVMRVGARRPGDPVWERALAVSTATVLPLDQVWRQGGIEVAAPILLDGRKLGVVRVGVSHEHLEEHLQQTKRDALLLSTVLALAGISLALVISRRMTRPLERLMARADELSRGQFGSGLPAVTWEKDEIGRLADTFDGMARRLGATLEEMREARENLRSLLEGADDYICTADMEGRLTYVNRKFVELGYIQADLLGRKFCEVVVLPDPVRAGCPQMCRQGMSCETLRRLVGRTEDVELRSAAPKESVPSLDGMRTGPPRLAVVSVTALAHGRSERLTLLMIAKDITERKELELRLIRSERLASIGELAGGMAHEIRNPLGSIYTAANLLSFDQGVAINTDHLALLRVVKQEARRLNRILTDFLEFARPRQPNPVRCNLNALCEETLEALRYDEAAKGKEIQKALDPFLPSLLVDADQMRQALWNIALNALQATGDGGRLTVSSSVSDGEVLIAIQDTGRGIPREEVGKIFEPFYTRKKDGLGLGLAIAHRVVEVHGGRIEVESQEGKGTKMVISVPVHGGGG